MTTSETAGAAEPGFSQDDVARILSIALERFVADASGTRVYTLREVAARTGMSYRAIVDDCRADKLEHVHRGDLRGMTERQLSALITRYSRGGGQPIPDRAPDVLAEARRAARANGARSRRGTAA